MFTIFKEFWESRIIKLDGAKLPMSRGKSTGRQENDSQKSWQWYFISRRQIHNSVGWSFNIVNAGRTFGVCLKNAARAVKQQYPVCNQTQSSLTRSNLWTIQMSYYCMDLMQMILPGASYFENRKTAPLRFNLARFAYLSACHTSLMQDFHLLDKSIVSSL